MERVDLACSAPTIFSFVFYFILCCGFRVFLYGPYTLLVRDFEEDDRLPVNQENPSQLDPEMQDPRLIYLINSKPE